MIRIIFFFLLTLMLSCANTKPAPEKEVEEPATESIALAASPKMAAATEPTPKRPKVEVKTPRRPRTPSPKPTQVTPTEPSVQSDTTTQIVIKEVPQVTEIPVQDSLPATSTAAPAESTVSVGTLPALEGPTTTFVKTDRRKQRFLPTRRRIDREVNKLKFAYKGEVMTGLTASYGTLTSDDTDYMMILDNIKAKGTVATVKPFIGYFYRDNNCLGVRFGYRHVGGSINSAAIDLGESNDIKFNIPYIDLKSDNFSFGIFHRSYAGLDPKGRFGLFAEFELSLSTGTSEFAFEDKRTYSDNTQVKLSFNPGAAVYIFPNVCATLSFGLGGIQYTSVTQKDSNGKKIGTRKASDMKFKLNIAAINIGMTVHLWDKKKK